MSELSEKCQTSTSSGSSSKSLGVHKFCSKLRHKIEDNLNSARLTNKLRKSSRHSMSMSALSGIADATTGKYTNKSGKSSKEVLTKTTKSLQVQPGNQQHKSGMLKHKRVVTKSVQHLLAEEKTSKPEGSDMTTHNEITDSFTYVDSDDEYQLPSLSWTKQSLEDEIFEELEKAAHDENKLNSVLKSFDRILTDFHDEIDAKNLLESNKKLENHANAVEKAEKQHKIDLVSSNNLDKNLTFESGITNLIENSHVDESEKKLITEIKFETNTKTDINKISAQNSATIKKLIPLKLSKSRTTLCENNLPKKLSPTSKLNKSVLDVATPTTMPVASKIPIWKALPLSKRSKSFCYAPSIETKQKPIAINPINTSMRNRAISYTTLPRHKQAQQQNQRPPMKNNNNNKLIKSKTELNVKTKPQYRNSSKPIAMLPQSQPLPQRCGNLRSHTNSDELLDKCLEKGQEILRKIETLGEQGARLKAATQIAVKKTIQPATKITPTIDKIKKSSNKEPKILESYQNLEINKKDPKYLADKGRQYSDALSDDSGHISNEPDANQTGGLCESSTSTMESLCDIETDTTTHLNNSMTSNANIHSRSSKITELLQKFEKNTTKINMTATPITTTTTTTTTTTAASTTAAAAAIANKKSNSIKAITKSTIATTNNLNKQFTQHIYTSLKVSEVEPLHRVQTHIDIFPNYSKEVTTWFY